MPFPVQVQRLSRALIKRLGLQGHVGLTLVEDLVPVYPLMDGPEGYFSKQEDLRGAQTEAGAAVGLASRVGLVNPVDSRRLAVVESIRYFSSVAHDIRLEVETPAAAGSIVGRARDTRLGLPAPLPTTAVRLFADNPAGFSGTSLARLTGAAGQMVEAIPPGLAVVVAPDTMLTVTTQGVNQNLVASFWWRDFVAAPQELQPG